MKQPAEVCSNLSATSYIYMTDKCKKLNDVWEKNKFDAKNMKFPYEP